MVGGSRLRLLIAGGLTVLVARALLMVGLSRLEQGYSLHPLVREGGPLEWLQASVVALTAGLLLWRSASTAVRLFGLGMLTVLVRELDNVLKHAFFPEAHWPLMIFLLLGAAALAWRHRDGLGVELAAFARGPAFAPALFGLVLVLGYAQTFGERAVWFALAPDHNSEAKRFVEEGLELLGHLWLLLAAVETRARQGGERP